MSHKKYKKILFALFDEANDIDEHAMGDVYKFIRDQFFEQTNGSKDANDWFYENYDALSNEYDNQCS